MSLTTTTGVMVVAPRREPELVNHEWQDDDVLNVGSYEVEIVSGLRSNPQPNVKMPRSLLTKRPVFKPLQPSATSSLLTTRATGTQSGIASRKICSTNESTSREPLRKRPMLKAHQPSVCSVSSTTQPPAHKNDTQDLESRLAQPMLKKRSLPTTVVVGNSQPKAKKVAALTQNRAAIAEMTDFPDAIGTIDLPHSVAAALQPHQRVGVSFIWNCLTGNAPVTPHIASIEDSCYKGGCILADEMGLGKTLMTIASICALYRQKRDTVCASFS